MTAQQRVELCLFALAALLALTVLVGIAWEEIVVRWAKAKRKEGP